MLIHFSCFFLKKIDYYYYYLLVVLEIELGALRMLGKSYTTKLYPQLLFCF